MAGPKSRDEDPRTPGRQLAVPDIPQGPISPNALRSILVALAARSNAATAAPAAASGAASAPALGGVPIDTAFLLNRVNHNGQQAASTISDFESVVNQLIAAASAADLSGKQDASVVLTLLVALGVSSGVVEYLGENEVVLRSVGTGLPTSLLTTAVGDARYTLAGTGQNSYFPGGW